MDPRGWRTPLPKRGTGQEGITRNECVKGCPPRAQANLAVLLGKEGFPSISITETWEGNKGPEWAGKTE